MKIIKKFSPNEKDLKESAVQTELMKDFPPIYKERNPEVLAELIAGFVKESGGIIVDDDTPNVPDEAPLQVRGKRTLTVAGSEATCAQTKKKSKNDKSEAQPDSSSAPISKRKRGKGESSITKDAASEADALDWDAKAVEPKAKKQQLTRDEIFCPMFVLTPEMAKQADEQARTLLEERKKEKAKLKAARDAKLQSIGLDGCDEFYMEKLAEIKQIVDSVEQLAMKETKDMLEKIPEASEADASEASPKVTQTSDSPLIIPTHISPSNEYDHDDIPLGQRMKKLHKPSSQSQQTTNQPPLQEEQTSAAAECSEDPEEPKTSNLPRCDSPSNLFSLERHLGGEITKTPEKATTSVPEQTDVVNQQQPEPIQQTTPEPPSTSTKTQTSTPTQTSTKLQIILEFVVESVAEESVQVTESETTISITDPSLTNNQPATTNDQPSSSIIHTTKPSNPNLMESEYLEAELQQLVQLRRSPTLKVAYQDRWATLKARASKLLDSVSKKCIKIQDAAYMHRFSSVHLIEEDQAPLYLANTPYFPESDYMTREAKLFKLLKEKVKKEQEAAKAR